MRAMWLLTALSVLAGCTDAADQVEIPNIPVIDRWLLEGDSPELSMSWATSSQDPFKVTFTLKGGASRPLAWAFDLDGDGKADHDGRTLPVTVEHTYPAVGDWRMTFVVQTNAGKTAMSSVVELELYKTSVGGFAVRTGQVCTTEPAWPPISVAGWDYALEVEASTTRPTPPEGGQLQFQDAEGAWVNVPAKGKVEGWAAGLRLCPPMAWQGLSYIYFVRFTPPPQL